MSTPLKWTVAVDDREHPIGGGKPILTACQGDASRVQVWTDEPDPNDVQVRAAVVVGTGQAAPRRLGARRLRARELLAASGVARLPTASTDQGVRTTDLQRRDRGGDRRMRWEIAAIVVLVVLAWAALGTATLVGLADWLVPR